MHRVTFWLRQAALACAFGSISCLAQTAVAWNSTSGTDFSTGSNWSGGTAPANSLLTNTASFTSATGAVSPVLAADRSIAGLSFLSGGSGSVSFILSGSGTLTLGASGIIQTAGRSETISLPLSLGASQSWTNTGANGTLNVSGAIDLNGFSLGVQAGAGGATSNVAVTSVISGTGGGSIAKSGGSTLTLSGANTYSGGTTISNGATSAAGTLNINNGGGGGTSSAIGTGTLTFANAATIDNTSGSAVTLSTNNAQNWNASFTFTGSNNLNLGTGAVTLGSTNNITVSANTLTVGGAISGAFGLNKAGAGALVFSGTNTYTGATTVSGGTLSVSVIANAGSPSGIGNATSAAGNLVLNSGTLQYTGVTASTDRNLTIQIGGGTIDSSGSGALSFTSSTNFSFGSTTASRTLTLTGSNTGANTFSPGITDGNTGSGYLTSLVKSGAGTWVVTKTTNAYTGGTTVTAGTLAFANGSLGSSGAITMNGGTLQWNGSNTQDISSRLTLVAATTATFDTNGNSVTLANAIGGGTSAALAKTGSGTLTLSGSNTFSGGVTVSAGTLSAGHAGALGSGATTIGSSGTLSVASSITIPNSIVVTGTLSGSASSSLFTGTISGTGTLGGTLTIASGGSIAPGNSPGILNVSGSVNYASGSSYAWELNALTTSGAGTNFDQILVGTFGGLAINSGATLVPSFTGSATSPAAADSFWNTARSWTVVDKTGSGTVTGTAFTVSNSGWTNGTFSTTISGNTVTLDWAPSAIPEPSTYAAIFGGLALVGAVWHRRRQCKAA